MLIDSRRPKRRRWLPPATLATVAVVGAAAAWLHGWRPAHPPAVVESENVAEFVVTSEPVPVGPPLTAIHYTVRAGDTLERIFRQFKFELADLAAIRAAAARRSHIDQLARGEIVVLLQRNALLEGLERNLSLTERLRVYRSATGFDAEISARPIETLPTLVHGVIDSSLFDAGNNAGLQDQTILKLAQVFGWDIDFILDLRHGDVFDVLYERLSEHGGYLQDGEILAARFVNGGHEFRTVRYVRPDGAAGYFTPEGRSMQKAFLRAPLEFRRVSSRFSSGRYHPILNIIRAHRGIDYAAAQGTPVRAAGAGRVRFRGVKGGYGNVVELDHGGGIVTVYGHLSRIAPAARVGAQVTQGEVIGNVGMTGLATGPHLHYEYRVNGSFVDPARVKLPDATPIDAALQGDFAARTAPLLAALLPPAIAPAAVAPAVAPASAVPAAVLPAATPR
jgi:murein DD-endopeptidase MepM/ murein hydrolase activator NlpD